jgi:hypothetical protein
LVGFDPQRADRGEQDREQRCLAETRCTRRQMGPRSDDVAGLLPEVGSALGEIGGECLGVVILNQDATRRAATPAAWPSRRAVASDRSNSAPRMMPPTRTPAAMIAAVTNCSSERPKARKRPAATTGRATLVKVL